MDIVVYVLLGLFGLFLIYLGQKSREKSLTDEIEKRIKKDGK